MCNACEVGDVEHKSGITCTRRHIVKAGDACFGIRHKYDVTDVQFHLLNPGLNDSSCGVLRAKQSICVSGYSGLPALAPNCFFHITVNLLLCISSAQSIWMHHAATNTAAGIKLSGMECEKYGPS